MRLSAIDYQKERKESKYLLELKAQRERDLQDSLTRETDLHNSCPTCHIVRSAVEIKKGICENCGFMNKLKGI